ncbi:dihydroorotase family protein [Rufibacter glacialis]|uniref:Dihydroorotase n=1 Tax=Rufibacter glacialis TaxID=1259555 RepID=A0A5M8QPA3_9BACT|nr:dihydroorotase [Rufibacter glacialis]KAA6438047.1 dihydroorotase [Rufibacter glacialis]GGK89521.1 dihydroorotase [Rufibacter glacialis]
MDLLFKAVTIVDASSAFNGQTVDLLLKEGRLHQMASSLEVDNAQVIPSQGLHCSIGWFDLIAFTGEPGFEHRETLDNFMKAAAFGGFTEVACLPNVDPVTQTRSSLEFFKNRSKTSAVRLHPIAAITHNLEGKDLSEILDLKEAGAIAFSDGHGSLQAEDTILKALEYLRLFGGVLINHPENKKIASGGQMHEGLASTRLGMKGIPAIAEEVQVARDLQLLNYVGGKLHLSQLSTAAGLQLVRTAKAQGLHVTCDVAAHQAAFTDEMIAPFDTNYKVSPPFRSEEDRLAILEALQDGTIDALVSAHSPWNEEAKELEFDLAEPGIIGLQTAFSVANGTMSSHVSWNEIVEKFTVGSRKVVSLPIPALEVGEEANLTFFHPTQTWVFDESLNASAAKNSPFLGQMLKGCVFGTYMNGQFTPNPAYQN